MYHIRRKDNRDERSIHAENADGLRAAREEAILRTVRTRQAHEVVDDNGVELCLVVPLEDPDEGPGYGIIKPRRVSCFWFAMTAFWTAVILFRVVYGKEIW